MPFSVLSPLSSFPHQDQSIPAAQSGQSIGLTHHSLTPQGSFLSPISQLYILIYLGFFFFGEMQTWANSTTEEGPEKRQNLLGIR